MSLKSLRLFSAPSESVYHEIDMLDFGAYEHEPDVVYDAVTDTIDGTKNITKRNRRKAFNIRLYPIAATNYWILRRMIRARQELCLEANVGQYTGIYAPFQRALQDDEINLHVGASSTFARNLAATYQDDDGFIKEVDIDYARFESCKMGKGILLEEARTNYLYRSHPVSGDTIWSQAGGTTPSISWDANMSSNVYGEDGTARIRGDTNDVVDKDVSVTNGNKYSCYIWAKGVGRVSLSIINVTGSPTAKTVDLTADWQLIAVENLTATSTTITFELWLLEDDTICWTSAMQCEEGRFYTSYIPTTTATVTRPIDNLSIVGNPNPNTAEGSIAMWIKHPRVVTGANPCCLFKFSDDFVGVINASGLIAFQLSNTNVVTYDPSKSAGDTYHIAFVWKEDYAAIIVGGIQGNSITNRDRDDITVSQVYLLNGTHAPNTVIEDFRVDTRYVEWRSNQPGNEYDKYNEDEHYKLIKETTGRYFRIFNEKFKPLEGTPSSSNGSFLLMESSSPGDQTIEDA